jgi:hypothetical protein
VRSHIGIVVLALCIVAAGCSSSPDVGIVKGEAVRCGEPRSGQPPVTVTVYSAALGSVRAKVVAQTSASTSDQAYELQLRPGTYVLWAPVSGLGPRNITVREGATLVEDFNLHCK